jgi:hypothetical protein
MRIHLRHTREIEHDILPCQQRLGGGSAKPLRAVSEHQPPAAVHDGHLTNSIELDIHGIGPRTRGQPKGIRAHADFRCGALQVGCQSGVRANRG